MVWSERADSSVPVTALTRQAPVIAGPSALWTVMLEQPVPARSRMRKHFATDGRRASIRAYPPVLAGDARRIASGEGGSRRVGRGHATQAAHCPEVSLHR